MTFVKIEYFVNTSSCSILNSNHLACLGTNVFVVCRVHQFFVPLIASTRLWASTTINTSTYSSSLNFSLIVFYVFIECDVFNAILKREISQNFTYIKEFIFISSLIGCCVINFIYPGQTFYWFTCLCVYKWLWNLCVVRSRLVL